ncbi:hypothetical protein [Parenemella sanctibonifatiensis]|uniref:Uncharacterized protein n=1 Tax=Parenemella sanctibonifatiensis TaxID=2016505 RepID=A0A255E272_9ACTN|nr:hypothetical protein [Parenemella sanctibonifatiensis]OYN85410.1 hypothetical protein CGZ92_11555 [Parenemella sanctibonifatiensis]
MAFDFTGFLLDRPITEADLTKVTGGPVTATEQVSFVDALSPKRPRATLDVLSLPTSAFVFIDMELAAAMAQAMSAGKAAQIPGQFMLVMHMDVAQTYAVGVATDGKLTGLSAMAEGKVAQADGILQLDAEAAPSEQIWARIESWTGLTVGELAKQQLQRYRQGEDKGATQR